MRLYPLLLLPVLLLGCGNVCDRMCDARADLADRCMETWELSWEALSYPGGRGEYLERCEAVTGDALDDLDSDDPARDELIDECTADLDAAAADTDCETLLD